MDNTPLLGVKRDIEDLKESLETAHGNNVETQKQLSGFIREIKIANDRLANLETEFASLRSYVNDLESYCVSIDTIMRKHHILVTNLPETQNESVNLAAFRVLSTCFPNLLMSDIDYSYRIGNNPRDRDNNVRPILVKLLREDYTR